MFKHAIRTVKPAKKNDLANQKRQPKQQDGLGYPFRLKPVIGHPPPGQYQWGNHDDTESATHPPMEQVLKIGFGIEKTGNQQGRAAIQGGDTTGNEPGQANQPQVIAQGA